MTGTAPATTPSRWRRRYLAAVNALGVDATSYARRAAGYLMAFGAPKVGEPRLTPDGFGERWLVIDVNLNKQAVLWLVLREHIPNTGTKVEDIFVGKRLVAMFNCDREEILAETERERRGEPFSGENFQMMVGVADKPYLLNPADAVGVSEHSLYEVAGEEGPEGIFDGQIYLPRIPRDAAEAKAMLQMMTVTADLSGEPGSDPTAIRTYAGYTDAELMRGKPGVRVR